MGRPKKSQREKDLTGRYLSGNLDEDRLEGGQRFSSRNKNATQQKILKTALMRAEEQAADVNPEALPVGEVVQVFSLFCDVQHEGRTYLCVVRKTMTKVADTSLVVGDRVRFRVIENPSDVAAGAAGAEATRVGGRSTGAAATREPEAVVEQILPRKTLMTRTESHRGVDQHPIVANAEQMLIVASLRHPTVKWGLVDRIIVAALGGGLKPIVCLNKVDLAHGEGTAAPLDELAPEDEVEAAADNAAARERQSADDLAFAREALAHYRTMGIEALETSAERGVGLDTMRDLLRGRTTVLAGHSGVGKSSLIRAIQPQLDLKVGEVSRYTDKGRHTTTSARRYPLDFGGAVVDTPGVKHFGLWGVTRDNLEEFFPDVAGGTGPQWRRESYQRILDSLPAERA